MRNLPKLAIGTALTAIMAFGADNSFHRYPVGYHQHKTGERNTLTSTAKDRWKIHSKCSNRGVEGWEDYDDHFPRDISRWQTFPEHLGVRQTIDNAVMTWQGRHPALLCTYPNGVQALGPAKPSLAA